MKIPMVTNYGRYESNNYRAHTLKVDLGEIEFYYSYETIVAYCDGKDGLVCSANVWGTTTGKHLNWIEPHKARRINNTEFQEMLRRAIARHIS